MSASPVPPLSRWVRGLRWFSVFLVVLLIAGLAAVAYSAVQVRPSVQSPNPSGASITSNGTVEANASVRIENPGYFSFSRVALALDLFLPDGELFSRSTSPMVSIPGRSVGSVPIILSVPESELETHSALLTNDTVLTTDAWFNATYAAVFPITVFEPGNYSWGAPFANLSLVPSIPAAQPNGTVSETVRVAFNDQASFEDSGTLQFEVVGSQGQSCATDSVPVDVPSGSGFDDSVTVSASSGCLSGGGTLVSSFSGSGYTFPLPTEPLP